MRKFFLFTLLCCFLLYAQTSRAQFTHADSLRGTNGPARSWWDALKYDLHVKFNLNDSTINGYNVIYYKALQKARTMQIDLQQPLMIDSIFLIAYIPLRYDKYEPEKIAMPKQRITEIKKDGNAYFVDLPANQIINSTNYLIVYYHGKPLIAKRPPWLPGGLIWKRDKNNNPWISVACQGQGASVWYPCKDHQADEPDSAEMHITCPDTLMCVGNGRFRGKINNGDGTATYDWAVVNPINNYCIIPYIGKYVNFSEVYKGEKGDLDMNYWVLPYNLEKAKKQFLDAPRMIKAFEHWFGPYPFYEDGYKLVDAPHLGMEHQSATAYGNGYKMGYAGQDLSGSGWGLKWDFIIVHESGHEWFANNITTKDIADMWVHEGFTAYSEVLFTEFYYGKEAALAYVSGVRKNIDNKSPIIGSYNVNDDPSERSTDMYYKGSNMLHNIRQIINDDEKFRNILRGLNKTFYHQTVTSKQIENYISKQSGIDFTKVFDQYLRTTMIPTLEYKVKGYTLSYHWINCVKGFNMPVKINFKKQQWIKPTEQWKTLNVYPEGETNFSVDNNFYVITKKLQ
ncbi:MAG: M1 family metallopeptidase [Chitinophagaceae bacterium]|nr:M1 family metallopeptidase [Chitinophagaceae bacterium]